MNNHTFGLHLRDVTERRLREALATGPKNEIERRPRR